MLKLTLILFIAYLSAINGDNDDCVYNCSDESQTPVPKANYTGTFNGCGSYSLTFNFDKIKAYGFNDCCNEHDLCYSSCNVAKKTCDVEFRACLYSQCDDNAKLTKSICKDIANGMYVAVKKAGCNAYLSSQEKSCNCL